MRCVACNTILRPVDSTRRGADSGEYLDMCTRCCVESGIVTDDRPDLLTEADHIIDVDLMQEWYDEQNGNVLFDEGDSEQGC